MPYLYTSFRRFETNPFFDRNRTSYGASLMTWTLLVPYLSSPIRSCLNEATEDQPRLIRWRRGTKRETLLHQRIVPHRSTNFRSSINNRPFCFSSRKLLQRLHPRRRKKIAVTRPPQELVTDDLFHPSRVTFSALFPYVAVQIQIPVRAMREWMGIIR